MQSLNVLILGGSTESTALARRIAGDSRFAAVLSTAGRTRTPRPQPIATRRGGFGGVDGLVRYLQAEAVDAVVDATHPFAVQMSLHAALAAERAGVPILHFDRPVWRPQAGDRWTEVPDPDAAAGALGPRPRRVFLATGQRENLAPFAAQPQHFYLIRTMEPVEPSALPPLAQAFTARGPFSETDEYRLLADHRIDIVVTRNSGGTAAAAKLAAARRRDLPVIVIDRPGLAGMPDVPRVDNADAAAAWLAARHDALSAR